MSAGDNRVTKPPRAATHITLGWMPLRLAALTHRTPDSTGRSPWPVDHEGILLALLIAAPLPDQIGRLQRDEHQGGLHKPVAQRTETPSPAHRQLQQHPALFDRRPINDDGGAQ